MIGLLKCPDGKLHLLADAVNDRGLQASTVQLQACLPVWKRKLLLPN